MEEQKIKKSKDPKYNNSPEYNKAYYAKNKAAILNALKTKCKCDECGRVVSYSRLQLHKKTNLCLRNTKTDLNKMKEQIENLTRILEEKGIN